MKPFAKLHPLAAYFLLTFLFSWSVFIPLALIKHGLIQVTIPFSIYYTAAFGPLLAALITAGLVRGRVGVKELLGRMVQWRARPIWWFAAFSPVLLLLTTMVVLRFVQGEWFDLSLTGQVEFMPEIGLGAFVLWLLTYGIGEETGWRGYALPILQRNHSALRATVLLWLVIAAWHAPAFFLVYDPSILPGFLPGLLAGAIVFTWLYNSTNGSVLLVTIFHGTFNFVTASKSAKAGLIAAVVSTLVIVWAVLVVILYKPKNLSASAKQVA